MKQIAGFLLKHGLISNVLGSDLHIQRHDDEVSKNIASSQRTISNCERTCEGELPRVAIQLKALLGSTESRGAIVEKLRHSNNVAKATAHDTKIAPTKLCDVDPAALDPKPAAEDGLVDCSMQGDIGGDARDTTAGDADGGSGVADDAPARNGGGGADDAPACQRDGPVDSDKENARPSPPTPPTEHETRQDDSDDDDLWNWDALAAKHASRGKTSTTTAQGGGASASPIGGSPAGSAAPPAASAALPAGLAAPPAASAAPPAASVPPAAGSAAPPSGSFAAPATQPRSVLSQENEREAQPKRKLEQDHNVEDAAWSARRDEHAMLAKRLAELEDTRKATSAAAPASATPACWYYKQGTCANGTACRFRHEGD